MEGLISQDRGLCIANARKAAAYMDEYATVYRHQGKYAFQLSGDPRPLVADRRTTDPPVPSPSISVSRSSPVIR